MITFRVIPNTIINSIILTCFDILEFNENLLNDIIADFFKLVSVKKASNLIFGWSLLFWTMEGLSISGSIRSIKMHNWAQCTMQEGLVCGRDVPWVAQEEQGFGPSTLKTYPFPIYLG
jgi:hypothetical protein